MACKIAFEMQTATSMLVTYVDDNIGVGAFKKSPKFSNFDFSEDCKLFK